MAEHIHSVAYNRKINGQSTINNNNNNIQSNGPRCIRGNHKFPFELLNPIRLRVAARKSKDNNEIPSEMDKKKRTRFRE